MLESTREKAVLASAGRLVERCRELERVLVEGAFALQAGLGTAPAPVEGENPIQQGSAAARELRQLLERLIQNCAREAAGAGGVPAGKPRVLVVDDSRETRDLVATALEKANM